MRLPALEIANAEELDALAMRPHEILANMRASSATVAGVLADEIFSIRQNICMATHRPQQGSVDGMFSGAVSVDSAAED